MVTARFILSLPDCKSTQWKHGKGQNGEGVRTQSLVPIATAMKAVALAVYVVNFM